MPYVNVRITRESVTAQQKARIIREITETLQSVLGKNPEHTHIVIDEVDLENWGLGGMNAVEFRAQHQ